MAYVAADPPGENNWWVARLYTQKQGAEAKVILAPAEVTGALHGMQIAVPRWSPGGDRIAFIGGLMSDQGVTGGDLWIVPSAGGVPRNLTPDMKASAAWSEWDGEQRLIVNEIAGGECRLVRMDLGPNGTEVDGTKTLISVAGSVGDGRSELGISSSADRSVFVFTGSSFDRAPEIYAVRAGAPEIRTFAEMTQLTRLNEGVHTTSGKTISVDWKNEGFDVQGWLVFPKEHEPGKKYPMIVEVHGGPAAAMLSRWGAAGELSPAAFSALGYFVLLPNPRGSYGQGEEFTQANRKDFGYGDLRDILAGVDAVVAKYPVDANRVGLTGWSYGGFMTMFAVTQTQRFKAAVAGAGISDWLSYYGENQIDQWMIPYFGASVYDDPQVYAKSSAINFIKQAKTPTLVVVGDRDGECPAPQSYEFWHALKSVNVPAELVVYPDEGHGFRNPEHSRDVLERAAGWFAEYMP
jgi:dipeptidyl aminopeptidase/acylaminoacyl peptidase